MVCVSIPWLNPFTTGPSASMVPWIASLVCVTLMALSSSRLSTGHEYKSQHNQIVLTCVAYFCVRWIMHGTDAEGFAVILAVISLMLMFSAGTKSVIEQSYVGCITKVWLATALISCGLALTQYLSFDHLLAPWLSKSTDGAAYANLRQRNQFATLCGVGLLSVLYLCQSTLQYGRFTTRRVLPWLTLLILAIGNGLSSSRTGALQWLLIVVVVLCWRSSLSADVRRLAYGALAMYALAVAVMPWFAQWVGNSNTGLWGRAQEVSVVGGGRMALYSNVIDLIAMKPWFGWGWRELAYAHYSTHFDVRFVELLDNAHNLPLHLAVELGVPFAVLFCGAVLWWVVRSAPWRETDPTRQLAWGILMLIGVHSMVEYPLWYGPFLMTLGLCLGLLQRPKKEQNSAVVQVFITPIAIKFIAIALLCITAYLAFDYHRVSQIYLSEEDRSALYRDDVMGAAKRSVVFKKHAQFAELVTTPVTAQTAPHVLELALKLIHFSPEPRVIEPLIESATMLHFDDIAMFHLERYKAMYPKDYAAWSAIKK